MGICLACSRRKKVSKDDPRIARLLGEYPGLDRWAKWMLSETSTVYNLAANRWFSKIILVIDKDDLEVIKIMTKNFGSKNWNDLNEKELNSTLY